MGKTYVQGEVLNATDLNASFLELKTLPINPQTSTYTLVVDDIGKVISATGPVNIPANVFASGGTVSIFNNSTGVINIVQTSGLTLYNASTSVAGSFTLNSRGICSVIFVNTTTAVLTGVGVSVTASGTLQGPVGPAGSFATISAGSAAAPSIAPLADTNTGMFFPAADTIAFAEGGAEAMRIDSAGRVGIGTTAASSYGRLAVMTPTTSYGFFGIADSVGGGGGLNMAQYYGTAKISYIDSTVEIGTPGAEAARLTFATSTAGVLTERMRIASNGQLEVTAGTAALPAITTTGDTNTGMFFPAPDTIAFAEGGAEAMRIDSAGSLLSGALSAFGSGRVCIGFVPGVSTGIALQQSINTSSPTALNFLAAGGSTIGSVTTTASATAYNTSSDYRLKNSVAPMTIGVATIAALKPVTYKWNVDDSSGEGFIAHELQDVIPQAVVGEKDAVNDDDSIKPQGVDYSKIVVHLVAAIQEQQTMITALTARITALEATP